MSDVVRPLLVHSPGRPRRGEGDIEARLKFIKKELAEHGHMGSTVLQKHLLTEHGMKVNINTVRKDLERLGIIEPALIRSSSVACHSLLNKGIKELSDLLASGKLKPAEEIKAQDVRARLIKQKSDLEYKEYHAHLVESKFANAARRDNIRIHVGSDVPVVEKSVVSQPVLENLVEEKKDGGNTEKNEITED